MPTHRLTLYLFHWPDIDLPIRVWLQRSRTRAALGELDGRLLADIGLSTTAQRSECSKWFWQA